MTTFRIWQSKKWTPPPPPSAGADKRRTVTDPPSMIILHPPPIDDDDSIPEQIGRECEKAAKGIFPLSVVLIRKVKVLKKPKFDRKSWSACLPS